jgi:hypothetical protein
MQIRSCLMILVTTLAFANRITTIPITSTFADDATGAYDVQSDGLGDYQNNVNAVTTFLTSNGYNHIQYGDWQFDTYGSTTRKVNLSFDPNDEVKSGELGWTGVTAHPPFVGTQPVLAHIEDQCTFVNKDMLTMGASNTITCPFLIRFRDPVSGSDYRIYMGYLAYDETETTGAHVTCNSVQSPGDGFCNDWFIDPVTVQNMNGGPAGAIGRLALQGKRGETNEGDFYMAFHFHLTR